MTALSNISSSADLAQLSALDLAAAVRAKEISPVEVMEATLARIDAVNDKVNAIVWRNDDEARAWAKAAADAVAHTEPTDLPPFHGVPIPIKELNPVAGWPLTSGSWAVPDTPSERSDLIVEAFQQAGFVLTGLTSTPEFGAMPVTESDRYGTSRNPWDLDLTPGGSSGGAGAAVASGMFAIAHGSDGGGSIRIPASCCGLVGLKVSRGRIPARVASLGTGVGGILSRDIADTAAVLDVISAPDRAAWSYQWKADRLFLTEVGASPGRLRIGLVEQVPFGPPTAPECIEAVREAAAALEQMGHHVVPTSWGLSEEFNAARLRVALPEIVAGLDVDWERVEPHIRALRRDGEAVDSLTYISSVYDLQRRVRDLVSGWGSEFDILLTPTMPILPPRAGDVLAAVHEAARSGADVGEAYVAWNTSFTAFTGVFNATGQPAISLPTHMTANGVPVGVQLVAGPWEEALLFRVASQLETALPWADRQPPVL